MVRQSISLTIALRKKIGDPNFFSVVKRIWMVEESDSPK